MDVRTWCWYSTCCSRFGKGRAAIPPALPAALLPAEPVLGAIAPFIGTMRLLRELVLRDELLATGRGRVLVPPGESAASPQTSEVLTSSTLPGEGVIRPVGVLAIEREAGRDGEPAGVGSMSYCCSNSQLDPGRMLRSHQTTIAQKSTSTQAYPPPTHTNCIITILIMSNEIIMLVIIPLIYCTTISAS